MPSRHQAFLAVLSACLCFGGAALAASGKQPDKQPNKQPFQIDDIYRVELLGDRFVHSPDGRYVAFLRRRPVEQSLGHHFLFANDRSDVWLLDRQTRQLRNLTEGARDAADFWYPAWSPSGARLAMVSNRGTTGGRLGLWVWEAEGENLRRVGDRFVDIANDELSNTTEGKLHWVSDSRVMFRAMPDDERVAEPRTNRQYIHALDRLWTKALAGREATPAVFEAGKVLQGPPLLRGKTFASCDIDTQACIDLADSYLDERTHDFQGRTFAPAPAGPWVATTTVHARPLPKPGEPIGRYTTNTYAIQILDGQRQHVPPALASMHNVVSTSLLWSPDGQRLAFVGSHDPALNLAGQNCQDMSRYGIHVLDIASGRLDTLRATGLRPLAAGRDGQRRWGTQCQLRFFWMGDGRLALAAERAPAAGQDVTQATQPGWWALAADAAPVNLTAGLGYMPHEAYPALDGRSLVYVHQGNLWLYTPGETARRVTGHDESGKTTLAIRWTDHDLGRQGPVNRLVYELRNTGYQPGGALAAIRHVELDTGRATALAVPSAHARLKAYDGAHQEAILSEHGRNGTRLWTAGLGQAAARQVYAANTFLAGIAEGEVRRFDYRSTQGEALHAWLILPVGYRPGRTYPMVTWVYQTSVQGDAPHLLSSIATVNPLNLQALAARGYAVLIPSMPGKMKEYSRLPTGVMPAIDQVIAMGIADPDRLAVMGQSNGGYSTYGLITHTQRFKAAVAIAGMTDLSSISLMFEGDYLAHEAVESGETEGRFNHVSEASLDNGLPWRNLAYALNSPISYVDKVQTPLLQLHGDHDGAPVQQAQGFFLAMERLGKRARLVQYMGDDHVFHSPANVRHSWDEVFAWLEEFMPGPGPAPRDR